MDQSHATEQRFKWLPPMGSWKFHLLLGTIAILILGPLGGITATYMNFSLGFFVGGQVLAGILGSAVTFGYGSEGKHGANYMQTLAASVASMAGMAVLIQAMHWLGFTVPEAWKLIIYYLCIGMFGVGVGMLYTPLLVDKMRLTYPSGFAVANILRALTDKVLLKMSIGKLALGTGIGLIGGAAAQWVPFVGASHFSGATFGAGMVVGVRIALPAVFIGVIGELLVPTLLESGWLAEGEPFRKIGFVIALGAILGAAVVDITLVGRDFIKKLGTKDVVANDAPQEEWKKVNTQRLLAWLVFWGAGVFLVATQMFGQEPLYVIVSLVLVFVFMLVNGISLGISDSNPISSAFVLTVLILASIGLGVATGGLICASILLISVSIGGDMQQDRSTGWRLGTNRIVQFRYQVVGVTMGAILAVGMASLFMSANPPLFLDQTNPKVVDAWVEKTALDRLSAAEGGDVAAKRAAWAERVAADRLDELQMKQWKEETAQLHLEVERWQAAMTYKFVGALKIFMPPPFVASAGTELTDEDVAALEANAKHPEKLALAPPPDVESPAGKKAYAGAIIQAASTKKKGIMIEALFIGIAIGAVTEILRKLLRKSKQYQGWKTSSKAAYATDFVLDVTVLASPYASSFGGFVDLLTSVWFGAGGVLASASDTLKKKFGAKEVRSDIPEDMSTNSLVGGGLIAGESLFFLFFGLISLLMSL